MQRAIFIDEDKCVGCYSCIVACKLEHDLPPHPVRPPLANPKGPEPIRVLQVWPQARDDEVQSHFRPVACMHCLDAPCIPACPLSAIYKDIETGIVLVIEEECTGCQACLWVCPYGSPEFHDGKMYLCDLCIHRIGEKREKGRQTACEAACPARAIHVSPTDEIPALTGKRAVERAGKGRQKASLL
jgi:Fe-S-cluster-containing dehydrogenase component